jgi:hypothetical protein
MRFIEHDNRVFGHLLGDLLRNFWIEEVMKGVNDDIDKWHLDHKSVIRCEKGRKTLANRTSDSKIWTSCSISSMLQYVCQGPYSRCQNILVWNFIHVLPVRL